MSPVHATIATVLLAIGSSAAAGCTNTPSCWCEGTVPGGYIDMACNDTVCFGGTTGYRCTGPDIAEPDSVACEGPPPDVTVNVTLRQAAIGVGKSDGCQWDGISCDPIADETIGTLVMLVTRAAEATAGIPRSEASDEVLSFLLSSAQAHYSKPDVGGWTNADVGRGWEFPLETPQTEDSYVAVLNVQYTGASLDHTTYALDLAGC